MRPVLECDNMSQKASKQGRRLHTLGLAFPGHVIFQQRTCRPYLQTSEHQHSHYMQDALWWRLNVWRVLDRFCHPQIVMDRLGEGNSLMRWLLAQASLWQKAKQERSGSCLDRRSPKICPGGHRRHFPHHSLTVSSGKTGNITQNYAWKCCSRTRRLGSFSLLIHALDKTKVDCLFLDVWSLIPLCQYSISRCFPRAHFNYGPIDHWHWFCIMSGISIPRLSGLAKEHRFGRDK